MLMPWRTRRSLPMHFSSAIDARKSAMIAAFATVGRVAGTLSIGNVLRVI